MKLRRLTVLLAIACAFAACLSAAGSASAWAPAASATIHPGVMTFTGGPSFLEGAGQCTANFVFTDASGTSTSVRRRTAPRPAKTPKPTAARPNRCRSARRSTPATSSTAACRTARKIGTLAYNSWLAMQEAKEKDAETCAYNDLALIKIDAEPGRQSQPDRAVLGRPERPRLRRRRPPAARSSPTATRSCASASACSARRPASASAKGRKRRLEPAGLHRHPGHPGRLRQRLTWTRPATRSACSRRSSSRPSPAATASARSPRSSPTPTKRPGSASRSRRARRRSTGSRSARRIALL